MGQSPVRGVLPNVQKQIHKFQKSHFESEQARGPNLNLPFTFKCLCKDYSTIVLPEKLM
jgi:hypothetical protein